VNYVIGSLVGMGVFFFLCALKTEFAAGWFLLYAFLSALCIGSAVDIVVSHVG
jgi:hypothetical protein